MITKNNKEVFERMSQSYIREDSHWGSDLDLIKISLDELVERESNPKWLDIGCGTGFHLTSIAKLYPEIIAVGMDYSPLMLEEAKKIVKKFDLHLYQFGESGPRVILEEKDITEDSLLNKKYPKIKYNLITFLNNGFGNLYKGGTNSVEVRNKVIQKISTALDKNEYFILSVYNRERLDTNYGRKLKLLEDLSNLENGDAFIEYTPRNGEKVHYYSHWFSEKELHDLGKESGLEIDFLEKRMSRFLVRYKKEAKNEN